MKEVRINPIITTDNLQINNCKIFRCSQTWSELEPTENSKARFCQGCEKFVFLCQDPQELEFHARRLHCVAFEIELIDRDGSEETLWMGQFSEFEPEYLGPIMTLHLNPTYHLDASQLDFLSRAFELGIANYRLREILCDGRSHVMKQKIHPDLAESLSWKLTNRKIEHQLSIDPE
jgi:hypothetical protein